MFLHYVNLCVSGVHLTGMYMNPVNAFNQEFGCRGVNRYEHLLVYSVGPMIAAAVAASIHLHLKDFFKTLSPPREVVRSTGAKVNGKAGKSQDGVRNRGVGKKGEGSPKKGSSPKKENGVKKEKSPKKENGVKKGKSPGKEKGVKRENTPKKGGSRKNAKKEN